MATAGPAERAAWFEDVETEEVLGGARAGFWYSQARDPAPRLSNDTSVAGGDRVREGYHGDPLLGGLGARAGLAWSSAAWPNLLALELSRGGRLLGPTPESMAIGDTLTVRYTWRDHDSGCIVSLCLDRGRNPYNGNDLATLATGTHELPSGPAVSEDTLAGQLAALEVDGPTYVYVRITDGVRTRYLYAQTALTPTASPAAIPADFDGNGQVDFGDFLLFADHFGLVPSDPEYDARYDLDGVGGIDSGDFFLFADSFGATH